MTAAFAIRDEMNDIDEAPGKTWFWELERAVIDAGRCVQCGVCIAACPSDSIGIGPDDLPKLVKMCTGCSLCWDFCPRGGLRYEALGDVLVDTDWKLTAEVSANGHVHANGNGHVDSHPQPLSALTLTPNPSPIAMGEGSVAVATRRTLEAPATGRGKTIRRRNLEHTRERYTARVAETIPGVQDGGVVSALLIALLEPARSTARCWRKPSEREPWKGVAFLAQTREDVLACAGSFYNQTLALGHLDLKKYELPPNPRIALVGTPCEIQGLRAMQARPLFWGASKVDAVVLTVALLCTKSFDYEGLMLREIQAKRGIPLAGPRPRSTSSTASSSSTTREGMTLLEEPIRDFHGAALKGCDECADFLGYAADISVGSVGSADGYSSVLIWTETGQTGLPTGGAAARGARARQAAVDRKTRRARQIDCLQESQATLRPGRAPLHRLRGAPSELRGHRPRASDV